MQKSFGKQMRYKTDLVLWEWDYEQDYEYTALSEVISIKVIYFQVGQVFSQTISLYLT